MELKLRQLQVQTSGNITGFNYSYCRILYDEAIKTLKTDIIDGNGDVFPIDKNSVKVIKERIKKTTEARIGADASKEDLAKFIKNFSNKSTLFFKKDSILKNIFDSLSDQMVMRFDFDIERKGNYEREIEDVILFLGKVKKYLSMFE